MMHKRIFLFAMLSGFCGSAGMAQTQPGKAGEPEGVQKEQTILGNRADEEIADAAKAEFQVPVIQIPVQTEGLKFDSLDVPVKTGYNPPVPRIYPPEKEVWPALYNNYVKVGFGRFATPFGKIYLNNGRNDDYNTGLEFTHISSSKGFVDYAEFRDDSGTARFSRYLTHHTLNARVYAHNSNYFYYADTVQEGHPEMKDSIRQNFTRIAAEVSLARNYDTSAVNYDVRLAFRDWFDRNKNSDAHIELFPTFNWNIVKGLRADAGGAVIVSSSRFDSVQTTRFFLDVTPMVQYKLGKSIRISGGAKINSYSDTTSTFGFYPQFRAEFDGLPKILTVYGGLSGGMKYNQFYFLNTENRYLSLQGNLMPTRERYNIHLGLQGSFAKWFSYDLRFYTRRVQDQLVYVIAEQGSRFNLMYDSLMNEKGIDFNFNVNWKEKFRAGLRIQAREFAMSSDVPYNFGIAPFKGELRAGYTIAGKIYLQTSVFVYGRRPMALDTAGTALYQNWVADVNLLAEYRFSKRFSVFLELNNLLNTKYYRWYNYWERPFDVKGGLTVSF